MIPVLALALLAPSTYRTEYPLPSTVFGDGWGLNLHFNDIGRAEETRLMKAGWRWVRRDLFWHEVETQKGKYDFSKWDRLMAQLRRNKMRPVFILCYGNGLYQEDSPRTPEARAAFCRYVEAAVRHFRGQGVVWEMWNEPNGVHWPPAANVDDYVKLALDVAKTIRRVAPEEWHVGPGLAGIDLPFLETCFKAGLLDYWDGVTVHPYRPMEPESVALDYARVRRLIQRYQPKSKKIALLSGEWGYSAAANGLGETRQADYFVRQYLVNLANDVPMSIWYNWNNNGDDPKDEAHNFGVTRRDFSDKPAYVLARRMLRELSGYRYHMRLAAKDPRDWVLLFRKGDRATLVAWTSNPAGSQTQTLGQALALTSTPQIKPLPPATRHLDLALRLPAMPATAVFRDQNDIEALVLPYRSLGDPARPGKPRFGLRAFANGHSFVLRRDWNSDHQAPYPGPRVSHEDRESVVRLNFSVDDQPAFAQETRTIPAHPIQFEIGPPAPPHLPVWFRQEGKVYAGSVSVGTRNSETLSQRQPVIGLVKEGEPFRVSATVGSTGTAKYHPVEFEPYRLMPPIPTTLRPDGDAKVEGSAKAQAAANPDGLPLKYPDGVRVDYRFGKGWKYILAEYADAEPLPGKPTSYGLWVHGDGSGVLVLMRYVDATGQTLQPEGVQVNWKGWRYLSFPLSGETGGRWGGANDGVIHYPIRITTPLVIDNTAGRGGEGSLHFVAPFVLTRKPLE